MLRRILRRLQIQNKAVEILPMGFTRMGDFCSDDIFLCGYPKSGNTWLQLMVAAMIYNLDPMETPDTLVQELVPDVAYKTCYKRFRATTTFKTHHLPRPEYKRVINIVRDGRDVLCSYSHYNAAVGHDSNIDNMIETGVGLAFGKWHDHILAWEANPFSADRITIRYEDLQTDCSNQLMRISKFLGVPRTAQELNSIATSTAIQKMKQREQRSGWDNPAWPKNRDFVRKGAAGGYVEELTNEQIRRFNEKSAEALKAHGYTL